MDGHMGAKAISKIVSEYDQEITQSQTADKPEEEPHNNQNYTHPVSFGNNKQIFK